MKSSSKFRKESNLEILRILCMIFIISAHFFLHGEIIYDSSVLSINNNLGNLVLILCFCSVNCYVIISSYFLVKSHFHIDKIIRLWLQVFFYSISIYILMVLFSIVPFNAKDFIKSIFVVSTDQYWFFTSYFGLYLIFPLLNKIIENISREFHKNIIIIGGIILSVIPNILFFGNIFNINGGKSLIWFVYLYFIGSYIRLYVNKKTTTKGFSKYFKMYLLVSIGAFILNLILKISFILLTHKFRNYNLFLNHNSIPILLESIFLFFAFKNLEIKSSKVSMIVSKLSSLTFGVYLIHDNNFVRDFLWKGIIKPTRYLYSFKLWILLIISVIIIYISCSFIEWIRVLLFKKINIEKMFISIYLMFKQKIELLLKRFGVE